MLDQTELSQTTKTPKNIMNEEEKKITKQKTKFLRNERERERKRETTKNNETLTSIRDNYFCNPIFCFLFGLGCIHVLDVVCLSDGDVGFTCLDVDIRCLDSVTDDDVGSVSMCWLEVSAASM